MADLLNWSVDKAKELFKAEVEKIHNDNLRKTCFKMIEQIPTYFWKVPASSSGKYHPECDLGDGGLVRHSLMVTKIGMDLLFSEVFLRNNEENEDLVRVSCLFHDCFKSGYETPDGAYSDHTEFEHPQFASKFLLEQLVDTDSLKATLISDAVASHMGKWNTSKYSDATLAIPKTDLEQLVHVADYMASRKYIKLAEEWTD